LSKDYDFAALENHLQEIIKTGNMDEFARTQVEQALHMLPKYKRIDELMEQIRDAMYNAYEYSVDFESEAVPVGSTRGWADFVHSGRRTITIELRR
jgi:hypothetical protein